MFFWLNLGERKTNVLRCLEPSIQSPGNSSHSPALDDEAVARVHRGSGTQFCRKEGHQVVRLSVQPEAPADKKKVNNCNYLFPVSLLLPEKEFPHLSLTFCKCPES